MTGSSEHQAPDPGLGHFPIGSVPVMPPAGVTALANPCPAASSRLTLSTTLSGGATMARYFRPATLTGLYVWGSPEEKSTTTEAQRDFQALHIDYGVPRLAGPPVAVARFTALYLDGQRPGSGTATRVVPLRPLLGQRRWPARAVLAGRLCADAGDGTLVEGILARIIEAADQGRDLPDREADGFWCGMEFATLDEERHYFARHGMRLAAAEEEIVLSSGELLLFDNLAVAHGRRGRRDAGELHQLCIGFGSLDLTGQATLLDRILAGFDAITS